MTIFKRGADVCRLVGKAGVVRIGNGGGEGGESIDRVVMSGCLLLGHIHFGLLVLSDEVHCLVRKGTTSYHLILTSCHISLHRLICIDSKFTTTYSHLRNLDILSSIKLILMRGAVYCWSSLRLLGETVILGYSLFSFIAPRPGDSTQ